MASNSGAKMSGEKELKSPLKKKARMEESTVYIKVSNLPPEKLGHVFSNYFKKLCQKVQEPETFEVVKTEKSRTDQYAVLKLSSHDTVKKICAMRAPSHQRKTLAFTPYVYNTADSNFEEDLCKDFSQKLPTPKKLKQGSTPKPNNEFMKPPSTESSSSVSFTPVSNRNQPVSRKRLVVETPANVKVITSTSNEGKNNLTGTVEATPANVIKAIKATSDEVNNNVTGNLSGTTRVMVSKLPDSFTKDHFIKSMSKKFNGVVENFSQFSIDEYSEKNCTAILEFLDAKEAEMVSTLTNVEYGNQVICFALHYDKCKDKDKFLKPTTTKILAWKLPDSFTEDHFIKNITKQFKDVENFSTFTIEDYCEEDSTAILEFYDVKVAEIVSTLQNVKYDNQAISFDLHYDKCKDEDKFLKPITSKIMASKLPDSFTEKHFLKNMTKTLSGLVENFRPFTIEEYNEENCTAILEFHDEKVAENVSTLKNVEYDRHIIYFDLHYEVWGDNTVVNQSTTKIRVSKLPDSFTQDHFIKNITRQFKGVVENFSQFSIDEYSEKNCTAILEFYDAKVAELVATFNNVMYDNHVICFDLHYEISKDHRDKSIKQITTKVMVSQLPESFTEDHFIKNATRLFRQELLLFDSFQIENYNEKEGFAILNFNDAHVAEDVAKISDFVYDSSTLTFTLHFDVELERTLLASTKVIFSALPFPFRPSHFVKVFIDRLQPLFILKPHDKWKVEEYSERNSTLLVDFYDILLAKEVCQLSPFKYDEASIVIQVHSHDVVMDPVDDMNWSQALSSTKVDEENSATSGLSDVESETEIPLGVKMRKDWPKLETLELLKLAMTYKKELTSSATQAKGAGVDKVRKALNKKQLYYTKKSISTKFNLLVKLVKEEDENWFYRPFVLEILNKKTVGVGSTKIDEVIAAARKKAAVKNAKENKTAKTINQQNAILNGVYTLDEEIHDELPNKFDYAKTLMLLKLYKDREERFKDNKTRASTLYKEISDEFSRKKYYNISEKDCSRRMAYLAKEYKRRFDMGKLTGCGSEYKNWDYWYPMGQLLEKSAIIEPQRILSFGSTYSNTVRNDAAMRVPQKVPQRKSRKRPSPSQNSAASCSSLGLGEYRAQKLMLGREMVSTAKQLASGDFTVSDSD